LKIKQPESNNALVSLYKHLDEAQFVSANCVAQNHEVTPVIYISSLLIMPNVALRGVKLIDKIINFANLTPSCTCLIRTTTPEYFQGRMKSLQKAALNLLRTNCYVVVFTPYGEFLNHAKFLIHYNFCMSEQVVHHGDFFGSTNFTAAGLGNSSIHGNFEEYAESDGVKKAYRTSSRDRAYLKEILYLINYKAWLYTDSQYLTDHVSKHVKAIESLLKNQEQDPRSSKLVDAYQKYLASLTLYDQTLALLDEVPGKNLTVEIIDELTSRYPLINPFEVEAMAGNEYSEDVIRETGLNENNLKDLIEANSSALRLAIKAIDETYRPEMANIREQFDDGEREFFENLKKHHEERAQKLDVIINPMKYD
jgi:hypothetical protein